MNTDKLAQVIEGLYPQLVNGVDFVVQDDNDGRGKRIVKWPNNVPRPTESEIMARAAEAEAARDNRERAKLKALFRSRDMRPIRVVARVLVKKIPAYTWQQFLADFDAVMDAEQNSE